MEAVCQYHCTLSCFVSFTLSNSNQQFVSPLVCANSFRRLVQNYSTAISGHEKISNIYLYTVYICHIEIMAAIEQGFTQFNT